MKKVSVVMLTVLLLFGVSLFSETLDEILAKNYETRGGLDKLKAIKTTRIKGKLVQSMMNMDMPLEMWYKKPNKLRIESTFQGRKIVQGYDGKVVWWIMPFLGTEDAQEMPKEQAKEIKDIADSMDPLVDYKEKGHTLELVGKEDMEGTEVYKLKLTKKDKVEEFYYLDVETGIELKMSKYVKRGENEILVETYFGDYKEVDGIMMAFQMETKANNQTAMNMTFSEIKFNEPIDDKIFPMPPKKETEKSGENK
jgi:outer membrane lipoprotein-sorting protein